MKLANRGLQAASLIAMATCLAGIAAPAEAQYLIDEIAGPFAGAANLGQVLRRAAAAADMGERHLSIAEDRADVVVEVVRDATGQCADGFHAAGLLQLRFEVAALLLQYLALDCMCYGIESHAPEAGVAPDQPQLAVGHRS